MGDETRSGGLLGRLAAVFRRDEAPERFVNPDPAFGASHLSEQHAARMLGLGVSFLRRIPPSDLPMMKQGSHAIYKRADVEDYIARKREAGIGPTERKGGRFGSGNDANGSTTRPRNLVQSKAKPPR